MTDRSVPSTRANSPQSKIGVVDFFCGCGGASYGFLKAEIPNVSIEIVAGIDIEKHSCSTYRRMIGAPAIETDIRELLERPGALELLMAEWNLARFDRTILIGCAPCQGFAAFRQSFEGEDSRRSLFGVFCELATRINPDGIFMENVPDLFSQRFWPYFEAGKRTLEAGGYTVRGRIYNFAEFGLPQERFRAVVMAMRHQFPMPDPCLGHYAYRTVRHAIGHLPPLKAGEGVASDPMHVTSSHRASTVAILEQVPPDGGNRPVGVGPKCLDRARERHGGFTDVYGRLAWDKPAVTMTTRCRTPSGGRYAHPEQHRGLSIREAALLQGFPDTYIFDGPFDEKFQQIGNAVPPLVAKAMAEHLIPAVMDESNAAAQVDDDMNRPVGPGFTVTINGIKRKRQKAAESLVRNG